MYFFYVRGSVHHIIIHKENPTRCNSVSKFYFIFIWSSTYFGWHTAHHQEPKIASSLCFCIRSTTLHVCKTRGCQCSFMLVMMGGVSPETRWVSCKYEIKFWYTVASCWIFYVNYTMMHGSTNIKICGVSYKVRYGLSNILYKKFGDHRVNKSTTGLSWL